MPSVVEAIKDTQRARRADAEARYRAAVREAAAGGELDPDDVLEVLAEVGKSAEDFARDTQTLAGRLAMQAQAETVPALLAEKAGLDAEAAAAGEVFARARKVHADAMLRINYHRKRVGAEIIAAGQASRDLYDGCPYPELLRRQQQIRGVMAGVFQEQERARRLVDDAKSRLQTTEVRAARATERAAGGIYDDDVTGCRHRLENERRTLAAANAEYARLEAALAECEAEMRKP